MSVIHLVDKSWFRRAALALPLVLITTLSSTYAEIDPRVNSNNCAEQLGFLFQSIKNAGIDHQEAENILSNAKRFDPSVDSYRVTEETASYKNNYMPLMYGGFDWPYRTGLKMDESPSNRYFFEEGSYHSEKILSPSQIKENVFSEMSAQEINDLSPIRKYALLTGDFEMNSLVAEMTTRGLERKGYGPIQGWEGSCYAMRTTGCLLPEPNTIITKTITDENGREVEIEFYPNDLKALAALLYKNSELYVRAGEINYSHPMDLDPVNPAVYHMFKRVYRQIKMEHPSKPYAAIFDVDPGIQIWNEGFQNFADDLAEAKLLTQEDFAVGNIPEGAVSYVDVKDSIDLTHEARIMDTDGPTRKEVVHGHGLNNEGYRYRLFLDENDFIIDGHWIDNFTSRPYPDFIGWPNGTGNPAGAGNPYVDVTTVLKLIQESTTEKDKVIPGLD